jgi:isocitrate/isopropylmalate dehydrogenase
MKKVCVIEGDDASPEVVRPTVELLQEMNLDIEFLRPLTGEKTIEKYGTGFPAEAKEAVDSTDCTPFGAASGKTAGA